MLRTLRCDQTDLGQMATQRIERRCALAGEQLARPMAHQRGLVVDERTGTNRWPGRLIAS